MTLKPRGMIIVLASTSGGGKTKITNKLIENDSNLVFSINATTRDSRNGEIDGVHYSFLNNVAFDKKLNNGEFLVNFEVIGNKYGVPKIQTEDVLAEGNDLIVISGWAMHRDLRSVAGDDMFSIFIMPPSMADLERRLLDRSISSEENLENIKIRLAQAPEDMSHSEEFNYAVVNDDLNKAIAEIQNIIANERAQRSGIASKFSAAPKI